MMNATKLKSLPVLGSTKVFDSNRPEIGGQDLTVEAIAGQSTAWFGRDGALVRSPVVEAKDCFVQRFAHTFSFQKVVNLIVSNSVGLLIRTLRCQVLQIGYGYFANQGGRRAQC